MIGSCGYNTDFDTVNWIPVEKLVVYVYLKAKQSKDKDKGYNGHFRISTVGLLA